MHVLWGHVPSGAYLQRALVGGGQWQREVHEGLKGAGLAVAGQALDGGLKLALEKRHDDGGIEQFVLAPRQLGRHLVVKVVVGLLLVALAVVRLNESSERDLSECLTGNHDRLAANVDALVQATSITLKWNILSILMIRSP